MTNRRGGENDFDLNLGERNRDFATVTPSFSCPRATGVAVSARFPPKVHDGPDSAASDLSWNQQVARRGRGPLKCTI